MTALVDPSEIESIVGIERHPTRHYARAVSDEQTVYILHSHRCKDSGIDLRECPFSVALDRGIDMDIWGAYQDRPMRVMVNRSGRLIHSGPGMRLGS
jgi:hypothetical protein